MLLLDKYRPETIDDTSFHHRLLTFLQEMSKDDAIPHIMFYGPRGSGKKTLIKLFLTMLFGPKVNETKSVVYTVVSSGNKKTDEVIYQSPFHIEIEPQNNNYDRYLIRSVVKEYVKNRHMIIYDTSRNFRVILINNIDNMSYYAQVSLRRTIEKYSDNCRFIIWCRTLSKVIKPLQSRCVCIRVPCPSDIELSRYIIELSCKENIRMGLEDLSNIIGCAKGNIKEAIFGLEFLKHGCNNLSKYKTIMKKVVKLILGVSLVNVAHIREELYNLQITNIDRSTIVQDLTTLLCLDRRISDQAKYEIVSKIAEFEHRMTEGRRDVIHYDVIIVSIMKIIKDLNN